MITVHRSSRRLRTLIAVIVAMAFVALDVTPGAADPGPADDGPRVMIISVPRLTWDLLVDRQPEHMMAFLDDAAVGDMSLRTIGARTSLGAAYTTLGAGNRAGVSNADAGRVMRVTDRFENGSAGDAFNRRTGQLTEAEIIHLSIESILARNRRYQYGAVPGALGTALIEAGRRPVVIANTDIQAAPDADMVTDPLFPTGEPPDAEGEPSADGAPQLVEPVQSENRPAGLALMTEKGEISTGKVDRSLLVLDRTAPFGVRLHAGRVLTAAEELWGDDAVMLVELSDLERVDWYRPRASRPQVAQQRREAIERTDALFAAVLDLTGPDDFVLFMSPAAPRSAETLTPVAIRGPGFESGLLRSGTTRRDGYVTLSDVAPTILHELGIEEPTSMTGSPMAASNDGDNTADRYEHFITLNKATSFRDDISGSVTTILVFLLVIFCALAIYALKRDHPRSKRVAHMLALLTLSAPVMTFVLGLVPFYRWAAIWYLLALTASSALLAMASAGVGHRLRPSHRAVGVTLFALGVTWVVLAADIVTGGRLQINTAFGYSPVVAGRFAGFGNSAYALFSMSAVLLACSAWTIFDGDRPGPTRRRLVVAISLLFLVTLILDGHPSFGSDVGGVLSIIPTAVVVVWLLLDRRLNLRVLAVGALLTAGALVAFTALDMSRPVSDQTHLARLAQDFFSDSGSLSTVLERKLNANLNILRRSVWTWTIPLALVLLVQLTRRRPRWVARTLDRSPAINAALWGGISMCVFGMALNDSGIAVPAMMFTLLLPYVVCLAVVPDDEVTGAETEGGGPEADESGEPDPDEDRVLEVTT